MYTTLSMQNETDATNSDTSDKEDFVSSNKFTSAKLVILVVCVGAGLAGFLVGSWYGVYYSPNNQPIISTSSKITEQVTLAPTLDTPPCSSKSLDGKRQG